MLNKYGILLTDNFGRTLDYQISYLAIANVWGRSAVAYGLTCSQACLTTSNFKSNPAGAELGPNQPQLVPILTTGELTLLSVFLLRYFETYTVPFDL